MSLESIKRILEISLCKHEWQLRTVGMEDAMCKCTKCDVIRKGKIKWGEPTDPYKRIKF